MAVSFIGLFYQSPLPPSKPLRPFCIAVEHLLCSLTPFQYTSSFSTVSSLYKVSVFFFKSLRISSSTHIVDTPTTTHTHTHTHTHTLTSPATNYFLFRFRLLSLTSAALVCTIFFFLRLSPFLSHSSLLSRFSLYFHLL